MFLGNRDFVLAESTERSSISIQDVIRDIYYDIGNSCQLVFRVTGFAPTMGLGFGTSRQLN